jgi:hypothetical protein
MDVELQELLFIDGGIQNGTATLVVSYRGIYIYIYFFFFFSFLDTGI